MNFIKSALSVSAKTAAFIFVLGNINCFSYAQDPTYSDSTIKMIDSKGNIEFVPDLYVTYECKEYVRMEGLDMKANPQKTKVTVNYGGFGRRRGFRDFKCLDN